MSSPPKGDASVFVRRIAAGATAFQPMNQALPCVNYRHGSGELYRWELDKGEQSVVVAVNGYRSIFDYRRMLKPKGTGVLIGGSFAQFFQWLFPGPLLSWFSSKKTRGMMTRPNQKDLVVLKELLESRKLVPTIDKCYPLARTADAIRYLLAGHARGKVVIMTDGNLAP